MGMVTMGLGDTAECKLYDSSSVLESENIEVFHSWFLCLGNIQYECYSVA